MFPVDSDYSIIVVSQVFNTSQNNVFLGDNSGPTSNHLFFLQGNAYPSISHGANNPSATSTLGVTVNTFFIASATYTYNTGQVGYFFNDSSGGVATQSAHSIYGTLQIGTFGSQAGLNDLNGDIAEIFLFGSILSNNDRSLIETYLNAKYGIF